MNDNKTPRQILTSEEWTQYQQTPESQYYKINVQQLAKTPLLLDCLEAPTGYKFVQLDYASLEDMVAAELTKDPGLIEIYASGKPHDGYLWTAIKLLDSTGEINAVYCIASPTKETVAAAKQQFKTQRSSGKVFKLMSTYKAGANKIRRTAMLNGIEMTKVEAQELRAKYWEIFKKILEYEQELLAEVEQRGGYIINALGRPLVVTTRKEKDVLNTQFQSVGHDCLDLLVLDIENNTGDIPIVPIIEDYHDETIWMTTEDSAPVAAETMNQAVHNVNKVIGFDIPLKGEAEITKTFTEFKKPDTVDWYSQKVREEDV